MQDLGDEADDPPGQGHTKEDAQEPGGKVDNALGTGQQGG